MRWGGERLLGASRIDAACLSIFCARGSLGFFVLHLPWLVRFFLSYSHLSSILAEAKFYVTPVVQDRESRPSFFFRFRFRFGIFDKPCLGCLPHFVENDRWLVCAHWKELFAPAVCVPEKAVTPSPNPALKLEPNYFNELFRMWSRARETSAIVQTLRRDVTMTL